jgi:AcrR family transcriptional regulator
VPRKADPQLEQRILDAACRLWGRGGEKALTMRAVARAAGTTTPTVYERYRDREDILRSVRLKTRSELFSALRPTRTLGQACERYLEFALRHPHAYSVLFDGVARPPSLNEPWPSFNLFRARLAERLGGTAHDHTRLMLSLWSLMHGAALLIIQGDFTGALRTQTIHSCLDAFEAIVEQAARPRHAARSGPAWPASLVLGDTGGNTTNHARAKKRAGSAGKRAAGKRRR